MKTVKLYWLRFKSETPKAIKRLQLLCGAVAASSIAAIGIIDQFGMATDWKEMLVKIALVATGGATFLQFTTKDKSLQDG